MTLLRRAGVLALLLSTLGTGSGCILAIGAGAGYVLSREVGPDEVQSVEVSKDVDRVWEATRESLEILHDLNTELVFTASPRTGKAVVDGAEVLVEVLAIDLDVTRIRIRADRALYKDAHIASMVERDILKRL